MKQLQLKVGKYDLVITAEQSGGEQWVALRPLCEALGMDYKTQHRKLTGNPQFNCGHMTTVGEDGKNREMLMIPVKQIGMWVCNINANRVKLELKDRLIECQKELQWVIHRALTGEITPEKFYALQAQIEMLLKIVETQGRQIQELLAAREADDYLVDKEASHAGSRLSAQRRIKALRESLH